MFYLILRSGVVGDGLTLLPEARDIVLHAFDCEWGFYRNYDKTVKIVDGQQQNSAPKLVLRL